ncbi:MAG: MBL fold metallo-hydrolase, partial [Oscillospiraceae bacterium]|nr:MBL fold metallo-hydrolase [Oscillospiraceae bacterium]
SSTSSTYEFLNAVTPDFCVIECGDNSFNHPNSQVVMRLLEYTENIYRTDIQGTVVFVTDGTDLEFTYEDLN